MEGEERRLHCQILLERVGERETRDMNDSTYIGKPCIVVGNSKMPASGEMFSLTVSE